MKIKLIPIRLTVPSWITVKQFCEYLRGCSGQPFDGGGQARRLYFVIRDELTCGLNLFIKDQKKFLALEGKRTKTPNLKVVDVNDMVEFNYFFIRHDNGAGVFTNYRGSFTGVAKLAALLRPMFEVFKTDLGAQNNVKYRGPMKLATIVRKQEWERFLREDASEVLELRMRDVCIVGGKGGGFRAKQLRVEEHKLKFYAGVKPSGLISGIKKAIKRLNPKRATLKVINEYDVADTCEVLGHHAETMPPLEYDEYVESLNIEHFTRGRLMKAILDFKDADILTLPFKS